MIVEIPGVGNVEFPDGTPPDVIEKALEAYRSEPPAPNTNPGVNPDAPPEMILNPQTGQYTSRELMANAMEPTRADAAQIGAMQGLSFGGADEAMGGAQAVTDGAEGYTFGREYTRAAEDAARRDYPWTTGGAEVLGAGTTALMYGIPQGARMGLSGTAGMMAGGGVVGATEGGVYGFLSGEGSPRDRVVRALTMSGLGGATGALAPVVTSIGRSIGRAGADVVGGGWDYLVGKGRQGRANRILETTLRRSGMSADDLGTSLMRAAQDGQGDAFVAADALGQAGQRRMSGIARAGGDASQEIEDFLTQRQLDQSDRVGRFVDDAFDLSGSSARAVRATLKEGRDAAADINFGAIRSSNEPVDIRGALDVIDSKVKPFQDAGISSDMASTLGRLRGRLAGEGADGASYELSNFDKVFAIRRELRDEIGALYRQGKNELASDLVEVRKALDEALAASNSSYKDAMEDFARQSRVMDAVEAGAEMTRPGNRAIDTTTDFARMTPDEQAAARVGYGDRQIAKIENATAGTNTANNFTRTKTRQEAADMALDPDQFLRRIDRENVMAQTNQVALGGSRTANNQADIADLQGMEASVIANILSGRFGEAGRNLLAKGGSALTGTTPETRRIVAQALMARDETAFRKAIQQAQTSDARKEVVDVLVRMLAQKNEYGGLVQP